MYDDWFENVKAIPDAIRRTYYAYSVAKVSPASDYGMSRITEQAVFPYTFPAAGVAHPRLTIANAGMNRS